MKNKKFEPELLIIDSFCGAGGVTEGFEEAELNGQKIAMVIVGINHDKLAIESYMANHPETLHFVEDMRTLDMDPVLECLNRMKFLYPNAKILFHASLECTNFSKAKGGMARDADSRTLAEHLDRYVEALQPDYITIENVVEFMSWGKLNADGKPSSRDNGKSWLRWRKRIKEYGYFDQWVQMNAANYGAHTSRNRLFGMFAKHDLPIVFPDPTHVKDPGKNNLSASLKKWKPVREVLELDDKGNSIFERKKPLSEKTLQRIYAGLIKFIAGGKDIFLSKTYAVASNHHGCTSTDAPMTNITTRTQPNLVQPEFISQFNSGNDKHRNKSIDEPCNVIPTNNRFALVQPQFIMKYFSGRPEGKVIGIDGPAGTIKTADGQALVSSEFIVQRNGGKPESKICSVDKPARTITSTGGNQDVVSAEFISTYHGNGCNCSSVDSPSPTIPTKDSAALVQPQFMIEFHKTSTPHTLDKPAITICTKDKLGIVHAQFIEIKHSQGKQHSSINEPMGSLTTVTKENLISSEFLFRSDFNNQPSSVDEPAKTLTASRHHQYLVNPSWGGNNHSVDQPAPVVVARQDKAPLYLVTTDSGKVGILIYENDSEYTRKIKEFMAMYGIVDIKMRMLKVQELKKIQGFPENYILKGSQTHQKKFIGNSVVPVVIKKWSEALVTRLIEIREYKIAV